MNAVAAPQMTDRSGDCPEGLSATRSRGHAVTGCCRGCCAVLHCVALRCTALTGISPLHNNSLNQSNNHVVGREAGGGGGGTLRRNNLVASCVGAAQPPVSACNGTTVVPGMLMAQQVASLPSLCTTSASFTHKLSGDGDRCARAWAEGVWGGDLVLTGGSGLWQGVPDGKGGLVTSASGPCFASQSAKCCCFISMHKQAGATVAAQRGRGGDLAVL